MHSGNWVVITGASRGIGAAVARDCAARDARLVLVARSEADLAAVAAECRQLGAPEVITEVLDLRDLDEVDECSRRLLARIGTPHAVVCNAGISIHRPVLEQAERGHDQIRSMNTNHLGHVCLVLPWLPSMAARRSGRIVGVSSSVARMAVPGWSSYVASKGALNLWMRSIGPELSRHGVQVTQVELGLVATAMSAPTYGVRPRFALTPEQAAARVMRALDGRSGLYSPWWVRLAALATAAFPVASSRLIGWFSLRAGDHRRGRR